MRPKCKETRVCVIQQSQIWDQLLLYAIAILGYNILMQRRVTNGSHIGRGTLGPVSYNIDTAVLSTYTRFSAVFIVNAIFLDAILPPSVFLQFWDIFIQRVSPRY